MGLLMGVEGRGYGELSLVVTMVVTMVVAIAVAVIVAIEHLRQGRMVVAVPVAAVTVAVVVIVEAAVLVFCMGQE